MAGQSAPVLSLEAYIKPGKKARRSHKHSKTSTPGLAETASTVSNGETTAPPAEDARAEPKAFTSTEATDDEKTVSVGDTVAGPGELIGTTSVTTTASEVTRSTTSDIEVEATASVLLSATATGGRARQPWDPNYRCRATQTTPRFDLLLPDEPVALDFEFQNFTHEDDIKWQHRPGSTAIVNSAGQVILHVYAAYPKEDKVRKLMPRPGGVDMFGVDHQDFLFHNGVVPASKVEKWIAEIIKGRPVVVHGGTHDLTALQYEKDAFAKAQRVSDTQHLYSHLQHRGQPGLAILAYEVLGESIQKGVHDPVEDAKTTMKLYLKRHPYDRKAEEERMRKEGTLKFRIHRATPKGHHHGRSYRGKERETITAISGHAVTTLKRVHDNKGKAKVQSLEVSVDDATAFPTLGAIRAAKKKGH